MEEEREKDLKAEGEENNLLDGRIVLCGANAYEQKYFFNKKDFGKIPQAIQEELHILCVMFTEDVGGIFTISFDEDGSVMLDTQAAEDDYLYDEINAGMMVRQVMKYREGLFEDLRMFYRVFILHESLDE